jgi:glycosyltransferase involved in cell wall biosynthesis
VIVVTLLQGRAAPTPHPASSSGSPPAISVIVAVYRRPEFLERVLTSLENQTWTGFEVVIADDGSGPEIADVVERWRDRFRRALLHVWHEHRGFRKTIIVNRAVARSSGRYLVFVDGDCVLHHRFLERHHRRRRLGQALSGRRVMLDAALTARLTLDDVRSGRIERPGFWWSHAKAHDRRNGFYLPALYGWRGGFSSRYEILGCNVSLHRDDFLRVNGYDERIEGRGVEDENLRARLLNAGIAIRSIAQEALQYHCHHSNAGFPHSPVDVERWRNTREHWTPFGVMRNGPPGA